MAYDGVAAASPPGHATRYGGPVPRLPDEFIAISAMIFAGRQVRGPFAGFGGRASFTP